MGRLIDSLRGVSWARVGFSVMVGAWLLLAVSMARAQTTVWHGEASCAYDVECLVDMTGFNIGDSYTHVFTQQGTGALLGEFVLQYEGWQAGGLCWVEEGCHLAIYRHVVDEPEEGDIDWSNPAQVLQGIMAVFLFGVGIHGWSKGANA